MNLAFTIEMYFGGPGSGCNPAVGTCGRPAETVGAKVPSVAESQKFIDDLVAKYQPMVGTKYSPDGGMMQVHVSKVEFPSNVSAIAESHPSIVPRNEMSIDFNTRYWNSETFTEHQKKEWANYLVDSSPEGVLTHEFGHLLVRAAERRLGLAKVQLLTQRVYRLSNPDSISVYAHQNADEFAAESFVAYNAGTLLNRDANSMWKELLK